ncbi:phosphoenolpyruvate carboxykinase (ATP) [Phaeodactylibacter luteus]|uniref:Phosphoenolpyruvate carboxykinase (ATP) n=1 Tax=Phaeodactylibacter luteus TaxID=1564516 RepID=A0A5C6S4H7_9BACT|nr:phosphoenolpyruvate carboxykinase (ATP) [Phaeodactylibacter luteus]TXB68890.1 phosphoenolpyruvate carboxykinase (ATP) [Phaeodactylibacter luteus]
MEKFGIKNPAATLQTLGLKDHENAHWNLSPEALTERALQLGQGFITDLGALAIETGEFTGRSPKDRFIVKDEETAGTVDWGAINQPISAESFYRLRDKIVQYLDGREVFVRDAYACADDQYRFNIRLVSEYPWSNQFAYNMFLRPTEAELLSFDPEWTILCAPGLHADPEKDGTRQHNFSVINFTEKQILIGGSGYTGEIKKGVFSVLNYVLPKHRGVLSMHCSANVGEKGDTAVFFGLSGTGKTTLSADPERGLIGDDEHGWSDKGVFNFEGGCYAKTIDLTEEKEPEIYHAIRHRAILENIKCFPGTRTPDFENSEITENTRVSYPIYHIENALQPSTGGHPQNIFFLTCDAFGVLPPISRLTPGQAMYHFMSGYTAKVAGTEAGVTEPQATFSACFGAPFMPLHPAEYAEMLGAKMQEHNVNVWLVNTGWTGGAYGMGNRIKLKFTRAMISAALKGELEEVAYKEHEVFGLQMPLSCPNVPDEVLDPRQTWADGSAYDAKAADLAARFNKNFEKFEAKASDEILAAAPKVLASAK